MAEKLQKDLQNAGIRVWLTPFDLKSFYSTIEGFKKRSLTDKFIFILSEFTVNSRFFQWEMIYALKRGKEKDEKVFFAISLVDHSKIKEIKLIDRDSGEDLTNEFNKSEVLFFKKWYDPFEYEKNVNILIKKLIQK